MQPSLKLAYVLFIFGGLAMAQDRGTVRGTVTDQTQAAVADATVTARNIDTGLVQTVKTEGDGVYTILYLPVGNYTVTTKKVGFRDAETTGVRVSVASLINVDISLTLGSVEQTVEVSGAAPLVDMQGTNLGKVLPTKAIMDLPLFISGGLRSNMNFIILTPGVLGDASNPRIGGGLLDGQSEQLDGAESQSERRNDPSMNGVSVEAVEEFKVQSSSYSAEYGRTSNGVINWVTKSGTNEFHGTGFLFARNEFFNSRGWTGPFVTVPAPRPVRRQWNPGGSIGGPVSIPKVFDGRNKAFFFFAFEEAKTTNGRGFGLVTTPIDEFKNGDLRKLFDSNGNMIPLYDPFDAAGNLLTDQSQRQRLQCNGVLNVICPNRIDPLAKRLVGLLGSPDNPNSFTNNTRSYRYSTSKTTLPSIKGDYVFNEKSRASFLYSRYFSPAQPNIAQWPGTLPSDNWNTDVKIQYYRFNYDYIIRSNLLNHITFGLNKRNLIENPDNINAIPDDIRKAMDFPGVLTPSVPGKTVKYNADYVTFGTHVATDSRQKTYDFKEQLAWIKGRHSTKFGFNYLRGSYRRLDYNDAYGVVNYSGAATSNTSAYSGQQGSGWAAFLLGASSGGDFRYPDDTEFYFPYYAWYAQDDFKFSKKLTINFGLRYELPIPKQEANLHNSNFCPTCPNPAAGGLLGSMLYAGVDGQPSRFGQTRLNAFGPRLGFAYELTPKTVIRAGGSIYYQPSREDGNADNGIQGFGGTYSPPGNFLASGISMLNSTGFVPFQSLIDANKPPVSSPAALSAALLNQGVFYYNPTAGRAPYFGDWQFTVERTLTNSSLLRVSYHATVGNKLLSKKQNQNQLDPKYWSIYGTNLGQSISSLLASPTGSALLAANGFQLPYPNFPKNLQLQQALRPYPQYSGVDSNAGGQNDGHMTFHAFEASFEHRFNHGLYMLASYTWAKLISNTDGEDANRGDGSGQNQYNRALDKAVGIQDTPQNFRLSYVYELPVGHGKAFLGNLPKAADLLLGGWRVSAIHTYVSGRALGIGSGQNCFGACGTARASFAPGAGDTIPLVNPAWSSDPAVAYSVPYLNKAAFIRPANMQYGNTPRRIAQLRGPKTINEDIAVLKNFYVTERKYFELRASGSNALNRHIIGGPDTNMDSNTFGFITNNGSSGREIQFGLKFYF